MSYCTGNIASVNMRILWTSIFLDAVSGEVVNGDKPVHFMDSACQKLSQNIFPGSEEENLVLALRVLMGIKTTSLKYLASLATTSLQTNLLLSKWDEILLNIKLSEEQKQVQRYIPPLNHQGHLFCSQLNKFAETRVKKYDHGLMIQPLSQSAKKISN